MFFWYLLWNTLFPGEIFVQEIIVFPFNVSSYCGHVYIDFQFANYAAITQTLVFNV